ncbi:MAG: M61 family metallopeptidase [Deltaproteobacteria bacterium]|nr:M61 family metallopeptidase [Deltaproteobacteria bacterium]
MKTGLPFPGVALLFWAACSSPPPPSVDAGPALQLHPDHPLPGAETGTTAVARYRLKIPNPAAHRVEIDAWFPTQGQPDLVVWMATWTPGSYLIREFSRQVDRVEARDRSGRPLAVEKIAKNRWRVASAGQAVVHLTYGVYARESSVRTSFVDPDLGILNGASLFVTADPSLPCELAIDPPPSWAELATALEPDPYGRQHHYGADSFDALIDAPILGGVFFRQALVVDGVPIHLAHHGADGALDLARAEPLVAAIVGEAAAIFGTIPFKQHLSLSVFGEQPGGGLEHHNSALLIASRLGPRTEEGFRRWLALYAHEIFHAWNGKRLRPVVLGPFDYEHEAYTEGLWFVEGFTSYYDELLVARAGGSSPSEVLKDLSTAIQQLESTPGRLVQSLDESSFDAWIKFYRPDEGSPNTTISYYGKGALLGFALDAKLQEATGGRQNLDAVMRLAFLRHSGPVGYTKAQLLQIVEELAGVEVAKWLQAQTAAPGELDLEPALRWYGLRKKPKDPVPASETPGQVRERLRKSSWLGLDTVLKNGRLEVAKVRRDGPAQRAGVLVEDELLAVDGIRLTEATLELRLELYVPGDEVELLLSRRGRIERVRATLGEKPAPVTLERDPEAPGAAKKRFDSWLAPRRLSRR